ncbi:unnamed protein product [Orchesella dallaii]|uniref:BZIP domain-containing protein n=1 Tax=Orchesella dallaii TaxID=48710 RepID=A0ABP1Q4C8_9HEXA
MEPYFILLLDDDFLAKSPSQPQINQELPTNFPVEVMEKVPLVQSSLMPLLQIPDPTSDYLLDKSEIGSFRVEQDISTSSISVAASKMCTEETTINLKPPSEETLDKTQSNSVEEPLALEEPTAIFSTEQLLKLGAKRRNSPIKSVPAELKNDEYYENRKKNAQAARLCRERKRKLDEERVKRIHSSIQEVEQLKKVLEGYKPLEEKYLQLQSNYTTLQQIVAKALASRQQ